VEFPDEVVDDARRRLRRVEGQIRGISRMLDEGEDCRAVVTQLSAARAALDRVGFRLVAAGIRYCATNADEAEANGMDVDQMEKLFLKL
jgi:DNA-binding FrmR family transcriptional regulator